jgi:hypothetical protein
VGLISADSPHSSALSEDLLKQIRAIRRLHLETGNGTSEVRDARLSTLQRELQMGVVKAIGELDLRLRQIESRLGLRLDGSG